MLPTYTEYIVFSRVETLYQRSKSLQARPPNSGRGRTATDAAVQTMVWPTANLRTQNATVVGRRVTLHQHVDPSPKI